MLERGTIDAVFILRKMQEEYLAKGKKLCMCFVDLEKAFDRVPRKVLVRSVMILYEAAKTWVRVCLSCQRNLRLMWGCTKDLFFHLF